MMKTLVLPLELEHQPDRACSEHALPSVVLPVALSPPPLSARAF
jgi:hypothetical protein